MDIRRIWQLVVLAALVHLGAAISVAQSPMDSRGIESGGRVAVIDMQKIAREFGPFQERLRKIRKDERNYLEEIERLQRHAADLAEKKSAYAIGSLERLAISEKQIDAEMEAAAERAKVHNRIEAVEAALYVELFHAIRAETRAFAKQHNISLVLNYQPADERPQTLAGAEKLFDQRVLYHRSLDMTYDILEKLEDREAKEKPKGGSEQPVSEGGDQK
ncbi:MAG: OmpH family outer membrane protein [Planctomycetales bacterium]|nr:OmpH family outer membrane protein [Planctomycetales bacterium]